MSGLILPKPEDIAYCAGLFEGEGTICFSESKEFNSKAERVYKRRKIQLKISMTDLHPMELFQDSFNVGNIRKGIQKINNTTINGTTLKPYWVYDIGKFEEVKFVFEAMYYWLSPRRQEQGDKALKSYEEWEGIWVNKRKVT